MSNIAKIPVDVSLSLPKEIGRLVKPLLGIPTWKVFRSVGSMMTMQFGTPSLEVGDIRPRVPTRGIEKFGPDKRRVYVKGEWNLRIECCDWRLLNEELLICHSESTDGAFADATYFLEGQSLCSISMFSGTAGTVFDFDLGGKLITMPYPKESKYDQWVLGMPDGRYLSIRADQKYSIHPGNAIPDTYEWFAIWPKWAK
jgi:hypothetical protein